MSNNVDEANKVKTEEEKSAIYQNSSSSYSKEKCECGSIFYDESLGMCSSCFNRIKHADSGCDDGERYF